MTFHVPEQYRDDIVVAHMGSHTTGDPHGIFTIPTDKKTRPIRCIATNGLHPDITTPIQVWEHVSVSIKGLTVLPTWNQMAMVKDLFWDSEDLVVQYHPPEAQHIDYYEVLHLWRPVFQSIPMPPEIFV